MSIRDIGRRVRAGGRTHHHSPHNRHHHNHPNHRRNLHTNDDHLGRVSTLTRNLLVHTDPNSRLSPSHSRCRGCLPLKETQDLGHKPRLDRPEGRDTRGWGPRLFLCNRRTRSPFHPDFLRNNIFHRSYPRRCSNLDYNASRCHSGRGIPRCHLDTCRRHHHL